MASKRSIGVLLDDQRGELGLVVGAGREAVGEREAELGVLAEAASLQRLGPLPRQRDHGHGPGREAVEVGLGPEQPEDAPERVVAVGRDPLQVLDQHAVRLADLLHRHVHDGLGELEQVAVLADAKVLVGRGHGAHFLQQKHS